MKLTAGIVSKATAKRLVPQYVEYVEGNFDKWTDVFAKFETLSVGNTAVTFANGKFVMVRVSSIRHNDIRAVDGPVVRVSNGEYSWRVDGDKYAYPATPNAKSEDSSE